jgi:hypothetical protein
MSAACPPQPSAKNVLSYVQKVSVVSVALMQRSVIKVFHIVRPVWSIASRCKSDHSPERRELVGNKARVPEETPHCPPEEGSKVKEEPMTDLKKA